MNYGVYNFSGNLAGPNTQYNEPTQQTFITLGLFQRADANRRFSWGLVHDWMISDNLGVYGSSPTLAQFRGQVAWATNAWNQLGLWSTIEDRYVTRPNGALSPQTGIPIGPVSYQAIDQGNLFWDHQFGEWGATGRLYVGTPLNKRLAQTPTPGSPNGGYGNTLGSVILGANFTFPMSKRLSAYANGMYMKPSSHAGFDQQPGQVLGVARAGILERRLRPDVFARGQPPQQDDCWPHLDAVYAGGQQRQLLDRLERYALAIGGRVANLPSDSTARSLLCPRRPKTVCHQSRGKMCGLLGS